MFFFTSISRINGIHIYNHLFTHLSPSLPLSLFFWFHLLCHISFFRTLTPSEFSKQAISITSSRRNAQKYSDPSISSSSSASSSSSGISLPGQSSTSPSQALFSSSKTAPIRSNHPITTPKQMLFPPELLGLGLIQSSPISPNQNPTSPSHISIDPPKTKQFPPKPRADNDRSSIWVEEGFEGFIKLLSQDDNRERYSSRERERVIELLSQGVTPSIRASVWRQALTHNNHNRPNHPGITLSKLKLLQQQQSLSKDIPNNPNNPDPTGSPPEGRADSSEIKQKDTNNTTYINDVDRGNDEDEEVMFMRDVCCIYQLQYIPLITLIYPYNPHNTPVINLLYDVPNNLDNPDIHFYDNPNNPG